MHVTLHTHTHIILTIYYSYIKKVYQCCRWQKTKRSPENVKPWSHESKSGGNPFCHRLGVYLFRYYVLFDQIFHDSHVRKNENIKKRQVKVETQHMVECNLVQKKFLTCYFVWKTQVNKTWWI